MKNFLMAILGVLMGLVFVFGDSQPVKAQETDNYEFTLEEITVTAQKREENQQKVPISMETITGEEMMEMGVTDLSQAVSNMSFAVVASGGTEAIIIRGLTDSASSGDSVAHVGVSVDGTYSNTFGLGETGFYDMQRVEVLAGPQGTLYSRNSSGGIINLITNDPDTEAFSGSGSIELGNYHTINTQGMLNVPLNKKAAIRVAFNTSSHDGYLSNGLDDELTRSARLKFAYNPSDNLSAVLGYEYTKQGGRGDGEIELFEFESDVSDPWTSNTPAYLSNEDITRQRFNLNLKWSTPVVDVDIIPSYQTYYSGGTDILDLEDGSELITYGMDRTTQDQKENSYELRFTSPDDFKIKWMAGLYYFKQEWTQTVIFDGAGYDGYVWDAYNRPTDRENENMAYWGNITYPITDAFRVTLGGRYTDYEELWIGNDIVLGTIENHYTDSNFDKKAAVEYDLGDNTMIWADYSTGFKVGYKGTEPQTLKAYSIGQKSRFLGGALQVNSTAFYYDYENYQLFVDGIEYDGDRYDGNGTGKSRHFGYDLAIEYIFTPSDMLDFQLSYLNAKVSEVVISYNITGQDANPELGYTVDEGPAPNRSPKYRITTSYQHRFKQTDFGSFTFRFNPSYESESTMEFQPMDMTEAQNYQEGSFLFDTFLNYQDNSGKWSLSTYVKNITNYARKVSKQNICNPRTYGAILSVKF